MIGLCKCGCGGKTTVPKKSDSFKGHEKGVPLSFIRFHRGRKSQSEYEISNSGCWIWKRAMRGRYAQKEEGGEIVAHRVFYARKNGPIPKGLVLDHLCRNTSCVNPDHLEAVTTAENTRRGLATKIGRNAAHIIKKSKLPGKELAAAFGVSQQNICDIRKGRSWK